MIYLRRNTQKHGDLRAIDHITCYICWKSPRYILARKGLCDPCTKEYYSITQMACDRLFTPGNYWLLWLFVKYTWITLVFYLDYSVLLAKRGRGAMWFYSWNEHRLQNVEPRKASKWLRRLNYNETVLTRGQNVVYAFEHQCKTCHNVVVWLKRHLTAQQIMFQESRCYTSLHILSRRVSSLSKVGSLGEAHYIRQLVSINQMKNIDMVLFLLQFSKSSAWIQDMRCQGSGHWGSSIFYTAGRITSDFF